MIDLSIIIVNWKAKKYLLQCVASILQAGGIPALEVIIIDNGSRDGSGEEIRKKFPWCRVIENERNLGFAKATNQGLRESQGRYFLLLNPDTVVIQGALERFVAFMDRCPEAGAAGGQLLNPDGSQQNSIASFPSLATELLNKSLLRRFFPEKYPGKERRYSEPVDVDSVIGAAMIVRREAFEQVGGLDEDYFLFVEETDWCYRMKKAGWKIYHLPEARICHAQGKSAGVDKKRARVEYYRSRYHFFRKNLGAPRSLLLHIGLMTRLTAELGLTALASVFTLFAKKDWNQRLALFAYLMWWHLRFCPGGMGLKERNVNASPGRGG